MEELSTKIMYYDYFANTYISQEQYENETIAPPERYLKTFRGSDIYTEVFDTFKALGEESRLSISYSENDVQSRSVNRIRFEIAERNRISHIELCPLLYWIIPANKFDEYSERFEIKFK